MKNQIILALLLLAIGIQSCAPAYTPNVVRAPLFSNKKEIQAAASVGASGLDAHVAYAATNHIGVMVNGNWYNAKSDDGKSYNKHHLIEVGGGYFCNIKQRGRFDIYGGYGMGQAKSKSYASEPYWSFDYAADTNFKRFFIQPSVGLVSSIVDFSFSNRFCLVNNVGTSTMDGQKYDVSHTNLFVEPVITAKVGYKYIKIVWQLGGSILAKKRNTFVPYQHTQLLLSIGLQMNLGQHYTNDFFKK